MDEINWTAPFLLQEFRARNLSPLEVMRATLERITRLNPVYNTFVLLDEDRAIEAARESEKRWVAGKPCGPLDGIPTTIKDAIAVKGWPTRNGTRVSSADPESADAPLTGLLREAGAIIFGKTTLPEFGFKSATDSLLSGITRNPWDSKLTPGGSSGGAAAAAAAGMGILHVGTDGGGSIRQPAAFCGVVGLKPSAGRVPNVPVGLYRTISCSGPIARSVQDCGLMLSVMAREDKRDPFSLPTLRENMAEALNTESLKGMRIAYFPTFKITTVDPEIAAAVDAAAKILEDLGAIVEIHEPTWPGLRAVISRIVECHKDYNVSQFAFPQQALIDPDYLAMAELGRRHTVRDYIEALAGMDSFASLMGAMSRDFDAFLTPTMPILPFAVDDRKPNGLDVIDWYDLESFLFPFSLSGQPAINVPCGLSRSGLPIGLQIVGNRMEDVKLLSIASALQRAIPAAYPPLMAKT